MSSLSTPFACISHFFAGYSALKVPRINIWYVLSFIFYHKFLKKSSPFALTSCEITKIQTYDSNHILLPSVVAVVRCIKDCAREWNKHRKTGDRFIHADEIRDFLKTDTTVFKYKFGNKWIVNYDQLLPHLKKINRRESKLWKAYMARIGIKKSVTPRKKWLKKWPAWLESNQRRSA